MKTGALCSVVLVLVASQADGFIFPGGVLPGRSAASLPTGVEGSSSPTETSSRWATTSFELNLSPYEAYMATRQSKESGVAVTPEAEKQASSFDSYMATREKQAAMPPAEKEKSLYEEYMASRGMPAGSSPAPTPAAAAPAAPSGLSPYEEYMASREHIKAAEAKTTPAEKEKSSVYADYMASRAAKEGALPADCAEEECDADEIKEQTGLFESYMASRGIKVDTPAAAPAAPSAAVPATPAKQLSPYEEYMQSRQKVVQSGASVKPEEIKKVSEFESYAQTRAQREAAEAAMPPSQKQAAIFDDYLETSSSKTAEGHIGTGGMADTRDPAPVDHEDPRKSISAAPTFAEYLKSKRN
eukprot:g13107.t1